jgi:FkbM family methyltransferase
MKKHVGIKDHDGDSHTIFTWDNPSDVVSQPFFLGEYWEKHMQPVIKEAVRGGLSVDIGANIGVHTVYMKKLGNVWAFEPQKKTFEILQANVEASGSPFNAELFNCALGSVADSGFTLTVPGENNNGAGRIGKTNKGESVRVERFDDIWRHQGKPKIDFIKIDVEGHELPALKGARDAIRHSLPVIAFEDWFEQDSVQSPVIEFLQRRGYQIKLIHLPNDFLAVPPNRSGEFANYEDFVSGSIKKKVRLGYDVERTIAMKARKAELLEVCEPYPNTVSQSLLLILTSLFLFMAITYVRPVKAFDLRVQVAVTFFFYLIALFLAVKIMLAVPDLLDLGCPQDKVLALVALGCLVLFTATRAKLFLRCVRASSA